MWCDVYVRDVRCHNEVVVLHGKRLDITGWKKPCSGGRLRGLLLRGREE
jgi:hypothetical protein